MESLRKPEWIAAAALLIQAFILWLQSRILTRHAGTMEKHVDIAKTQAEIAKSIGNALSQQGVIMEGQLNFQKMVEAKAEREKVFDVVLDLRARFVRLHTTLGSIPVAAGISAGTREKLDFDWDRLEEALLPCLKALITSIHISAAERNYFIQYAQSVDAMKRTNDISKDFQQLRSVH
jgi:hypothetical protein